MHRRTALPALAACLLLPGCAFFAPVPDGPGRAEAVAVDEALLHTIAREVAARPGVTCVDAYLSSSGVPQTLPGDPRLLARTTLPAPERDALVREVGERVWREGPLGVASLQVTASGTGGSSDLGVLLGGARGPVFDQELEAALGPRPQRSFPATPPPDPGNPGCPQ